ESLLTDPTTGSVATEARLALAAGADLMGDPERAITGAEIVHELASTRGEAQLGFAAESLIESIRNGELAKRNRTRTGRAGRTPRPLISLIEDLESALSE